MKFKPIYLYGTIVIISVLVLIFISMENSVTQNEISFDQNQNIPADDVHKKLLNQGSNSPSKENVSAEYRQKMTKLKEVVENNPNDTIALKNYADFLSASHKMKEAITYYEKLLKIDPKRADIHFALAVIYYNIQDFAKCEDENNKVLVFDPKNQMALYNLGAIYATKGELAKAKEYWQEVIGIDADSETGKLAKESLGKLNNN